MGFGGGTLDLGFMRLYFCSYQQKTEHLNLMKNVVQPDTRAIRNVMALGLPIGFSIIIEMGFFNGAAIIIAKLGEMSVSAHAVMRSDISLRASCI